MSDIEESIRAVIPDEFILDPPDGGDVKTVEGVQRMADEITTLRAEVERLKAECAERDWLFNEGGEESVAAMEQERDTLRAEEEKLRAVLAEAEAVALKYGEAFKRPISSYGEGFSDCSNAIADHFRRTALTSQKETSDD